MHAIYVLQEAAAKIAYTTSKRVMLEIAIIKLCKTEMRYDIEGIQARIESLEQQLAETKELLKEQQAHPVVMAVAPPATEGAGTVQQAVAPQQVIHPSTSSRICVTNIRRQNTRICF